MLKEFKCVLNTPQGCIFEGGVTLVIAPGLLGQFGVLANHEHMIAILRKGVLVIKLNEKVDYFVIDSGSLEVDGNHNVMILADKALRAENEIDSAQKVLELETPLV